MSAGQVLFVGCGPGAEDLLTLRAIRALEAADVVIWNPSVLDRQTLAKHTRPDADVIEWPPATQQDIVAAYDRTLTEKLLVVRLKGGDPTLFGRMQADLTAVRERGLTYEIVPGISALSASAASLGIEIATPDTALLVTDAALLPATPDRDAAVAAFGATGDPGALQAALLDRGLSPTTPCTVAIEVTRRDETFVSCELNELAETIADTGHGLLALALAQPLERSSSDD